MSSLAFLFCYDDAAPLSGSGGGVFSVSVLYDVVQLVQSRQQPRDRPPPRDRDDGHYGSGSSSNATLHHEVPNAKVGLVIGRAGGTIKMIQQKTGAHIQIPQEGDGPDPNTRIVTISASTQEAAQAALDEIRSILDGAERRGGDQQGQGAPPQVVYVHVPQEKIGLIIGRGGSNIKDLQARTQTRVQIPPEAEPGSNPPARLVSISGHGDAPQRVRNEGGRVDTMQC